MRSIPQICKIGSSLPIIATGHFKSIVGLCKSMRYFEAEMDAQQQTFTEIDDILCRGIFTAHRLLRYNTCSVIGGLPHLLEF